MSDLLLLPCVSAFLVVFLVVFYFRSHFSLYAALSTVAFFFVITLIYEISDRYTGQGITEATLFHALYGMRGVGVQDIVTNGSIVIASLVVLIFIFSRARKMHQERLKNSTKRTWHLLELTTVLFLAVFSLYMHPGMSDVIRLSEPFSGEKDALRLNGELKSLDYHYSYKSPPSSLIYIYAESLERTFFDESIFPGLIARLREIESHAISFRGVGQAPMTEWTIAGMVASQCGIPLATFRQNRNELEDMHDFIPGATCLGDILHSVGYKSAYLGGANIEFAGKKHFYQSHGFDRVIGMDEIVEKKPGLRLSKWGVYDDALFEEAFDLFLDLSSSEQPFSLFLLTLDTHPPSGHETPDCKGIKYEKGGGNSLLDAVKCSDYLISEFIRKVDAVQTAQEVKIVVASDHLQMRGEATDILEKYSDRRENLFLVYDKKNEGGKIISKSSTTMDIAPTVLSVLGWDAAEMALGRSLLSSEPTLAEKYGRDYFYSILRDWRMNLWKYWQAE